MKPCIYYCVISAQDSRYEFLSSLFFSCIASRLMDFARREGEGGRLPVKVNLLLEEFCNIGNLGADFLKQLAILRGFGVGCQLLVQSVPQLAGRYPKSEWEELISHCDVMICLGANDLKTAAYFSDKCGKVTIRTESNQMPLMPLFSPVYTSTRPYSQTKSSAQRALLMPDEILRTDNAKCLILLRGQKPLMLDKITPEEFPAFKKLKFSRITEYAPPWRETDPARKEETAKKSKEEIPSAPEAEKTEDETPAQIGFEDFPAGEERTANGEAPFGFRYPKEEYSLAEGDADAENPKESGISQSDAPQGKYGALKPVLKPVEISPADIKDKGVSLQENEEENP
jgi:type IV secretion system protein VirD4